MQRLRKQGETSDNDAGMPTIGLRVSVHFVIRYFGKKLRVCAGLHRHEAAMKRDQIISSGWSTIKNWGRGSTDGQTDRQTHKTLPFILSMRV
jgi:hypothetical protein